MKRETALARLSLPDEVTPEEKSRMNPLTASISAEKNSGALYAIRITVTFLNHNCYPKYSSYRFTENLHETVDELK